MAVLLGVEVSNGFYFQIPYCQIDAFLSIYVMSNLRLIVRGNYDFLIFLHVKFEVSKSRLLFRNYLDSYDRTSGYIPSVCTRPFGVRNIYYFAVQPVKVFTASNTQYPLHIRAPGM